MTGPDPCGLLLLAGVTAWAARQTVRDRPRVEAAGGYVGVVVFLATTFAGLARSDPPLAVLPVAGTTAGFAAALAWVVLVAVAAAWGAAARVARTARGQAASLLARWAAWRHARRVRHPPEPRPDPEAAARQAAAEEGARERARGQKRREDARARVEIAFALHAPELGQRFTRAMLDEFVARYMGDDKAPEDVEARADQLAGVIRQHLAKVQPASQVQTVDELLAAYAARRQKIQGADLDPRDKETPLIQLDEQRERDLAQALREGRV